MQCDEFEARLQNLLDARQLPERDLSLQQHARQCPNCQIQLTSWARLLDGLELLDVPDVSADFARQVVDRVSLPQRTRQRSPRVIALLAIAASLLLVAVPAYWYSTRNSTSVADNPQASNAPGGALAQATSTTTPPHPSAPSIDADEGWLVSGASILRLYPKEARQRHREQVTQIADDLRPIATPFNTAMTAIRRSISRRHAPAKGDPRASMEQPRQAGHFS